MIKGYYNKETKQLELYQKLIQYWSIMFDRRKCIDVLDNMNFNKAIFPEALNITEILKVGQIEPGYMSPDGYTEMNLIIREIEKKRLIKHGMLSEKTIENIVSQAGIGCGNGCTNVMNGVINSILKLNIKGVNKPEVILTLPNYTVYTAQLSNLKKNVTPKYVFAERSNGFLPVYEQIVEAVTDQTIAIVITYPNNPAQSTYEGENVKELRKIAGYCQEKEVFLIVDNIYQDLLYPTDRKFTEIFSLTGSLDYIVKVYGSSKDTPFYSGFRTGYWFGDPRIIDIYKYYISSTENSINTYSLAQFAFGLYFKVKMLDHSQVSENDMYLLNQGVFGWSRIMEGKEIYDGLMKYHLYENYVDRMDKSIFIQETAIKRIVEFVNQSIVFTDYMNQNIGNVFFIKINPSYFSKNSDELFLYLLEKGNVGILPGNVFGMNEEKDGIWFRITLIHDNDTNIIRFLRKIEGVLLGNGKLF